MPGRSSLEMRATDSADQLRRALGQELRTIIDDSGLTVAAVARAAGVEPSTVLRMLRAQRDTSLEMMVRVVEALGGRLFAHISPGAGIAIRDPIQARMIEALLRELNPSWRPHIEVAVETPARGSIDLVLWGREGEEFVASEFHSQVRRAEQVVRWQNEKAAALPRTELYRAAAMATRGDVHAAVPIGRLLVVRSTTSIRATVREIPRMFRAAYPVPAGTAVEALRTGRRWPGDAIVWMDVRGRQARLMDDVPRDLRELTAAVWGREAGSGGLARPSWGARRG